MADSKATVSVNAAPHRASLPDYHVPRLSDVPEVEVVLMDRKDVPPAGGGKTPPIAVPPALATAVRDASGRRLPHLPPATDRVVRSGPAR